MKTRFLLIANVCVCSILLSSLLGCSSGNENAAQVQGTVTIDGQLARTGTVTFHSKDGHPLSYGAIGKDGTFALRIGQGNKSNPNYNDIPPGDYVATVTVRGPSIEDPNADPGAPPMAGPLLIARKYTSKDSSDLSYKIKTGLNPITIALERPSPEDANEEESESSDVEEASEEDEELSETEQTVDEILNQADSDDKTQDNDSAKTDSPSDSSLQEEAQ